MRSNAANRDGRAYGAECQMKHGNCRGESTARRQRFVGLGMMLWLLAAGSVWAQPISEQGIGDGDLARYTCYRTETAIEIDGELDDSAWSKAPRSDAFVDIVTGEAAWFDTRVAMLWDDDALYFGFTVPETTVEGRMTIRDSKIYNENDVEIFIAGPDGYYEFEINSLGTIYEVFWIWADALGPGRLYRRSQWNVETRQVMPLDGVGDMFIRGGSDGGFWIGTIQVCAPPCM